MDMDNSMMGTSIKQLQAMGPVTPYNLEDNTSMVHNIQYNPNFIPSAPVMQYIQPNSPGQYNSVASNGNGNGNGMGMGMGMGGNPTCNNNHNYKTDIQGLAKDINKNIEHATFDLDDDLDTENDNELENDNQGRASTKRSKKARCRITMYDTLVETFKEAVLIFVIFIFLSLEFVKVAISKHAPQINPDDATGVVSMSGIATYGLIFAIIYSICKMTILR